MTDPLEDRLRAAAAAADAVPVPLEVLRARARRRLVVQVGAPVLLVLALLAGAGAVATRSSAPSPDAQQSLLLDPPATAERSAPSTSSSPATPATTAPRSSAPATATADPSRAPAGPSVSAPSSSPVVDSPAPELSTAPPPPASDGPKLLRVEVSTDHPAYTSYDQVVATVTVTNTSSRTLTLDTNSSCGEAFGSLTLVVGSSRLPFTLAGDTCGRGDGRPLEPGSSAVAMGYQFVPAELKAGTLRIEAVASFSLSPDTGVVGYRSSSSSAARAVAVEEGTRTFTLQNDLGQDARVNCRCDKGYSLGTTVVSEDRLVVTASIVVRPVLDVFLDTGRPRVQQTCLDLSSVPRGSTDRVLLLSSATACATSG